MKADKELTLEEIGGGIAQLITDTINKNPSVNVRNDSEGRDILKNRILEFAEEFIKVDPLLKIDNETHTIYIYDIFDMNILTRAPLTYPEIKMNCEYKVIAEDDKVFGTIVWEREEKECSFTFTTCYTPSQTLEYISLAINVKGGEEQHDGEIWNRYGESSIDGRSVPSIDEISF
ncbi:MAG: hypothetical protein K0R00_4 [Herbinix sp.]|jgi:hypothetical protein|nr:hypothetical protein [Herbinix sp.]